MKSMDITLHSVPMRVVYDYSRAEPRWVDDTLGGHPGCPAMVTADHIFIGNIEVTPFLSDEQIEEIEGAVLEELE